MHYEIGHVFGICRFLAIAVLPIFYLHASSSHESCADNAQNQAPAVRGDPSSAPLVQNGWESFEKYACAQPDDPEVVRTLINCLQDQSDVEQERAALTIRRVASAGGHPSMTIVNSLTRAILKSKSRARCEIIAALGAIGKDASEALPTLRDQLVAKGPFSQFYKPRAAAAIVRIRGGDRNAIELLSTWLASGSSETRTLAADALSTCGPVAADAAPALRLALRDVHAPVRVLASRALWVITREATEALPVLIGALQETGTPVLTKPAYFTESLLSQRVYAASCLGEMGAAAKPARVALAAALGDSDEALRLVAKKALLKIEKSSGVACDSEKVPSRIAAPK